MKLSYCMSVLSISFFQFPSSAECTDAFPVILSLIIIEGLLSVDNALAIAAMASHLPEPQKRKALRWGIIGAYGFRGIALAGPLPSLSSSDAAKCAHIKYIK